MKTQFRAMMFRDDPNDWGVYYLVAEVSGVQRTITGQLVNLGAFGSQAWSGIRGLSNMSQMEAEFTAELLNNNDWVWSELKYVGYLDSKRLQLDLGTPTLGRYRDHLTRLPGDDYMAARTIEAYAAGETEYFHKLEDAKVWVMATAARLLAREGYMPTVEGEVLEPA